MAPNLAEIESAAYQIEGKRLPGESAWDKPEPVPDIVPLASVDYSMTHC